MLKVEDVNVEDQVILMWTLKRKQHRRYQRIVLVDRATIELIKKYLQAYKIKKGLLFSITGRRVQQIVYETGVRAGISRVGAKKLHPHHFRHSHGVAWVRANPLRNNWLEHYTAFNKCFCKQGEPWYECVRHGITSATYTHL
ncbi:unnamed protein product [marine sediment metagenome]|uniref:Tyr recombinase domain-containing protein n=1 Tax=marine sediment metagenome TaxID=412755 RepID=X1CN42_9ZZZZ